MVLKDDELLITEAEHRLDCHIMSSTTSELCKVAFGFALTPISTASQQIQCKFKCHSQPAIYFFFHTRKNNQPRFYRTSENRKEIFQSNFITVFLNFSQHFVCFYFFCLFPFFVHDSIFFPLLISNFNSLLVAFNSFFLLCFYFSTNVFSSFVRVLPIMII